MAKEKITKEHVATSKGVEPLGHPTMSKVQAIKYQETTKDKL